jgi:hypothetical protein
MMMEKRTITLRAMQKQKPASFTAVNSASAFKPQGRLFKAQYQKNDSVYNDNMIFAEEDNDGEDSGEHDPGVSFDPAG